MAKLTGRRRAKDEMRAINEMNQALAAFTLPESLPSSEIDFPVLDKKKKKANWNVILAESEKEMMEIEKYAENKKQPILRSPFMKTECDYIKEEVFTWLLPALEETLNKAKLWDAMTRQRCFFNGIDHVVQVLWNNNPRHPNRNAQHPNLHIFNMPWVREWFKEHPRPYYPKSWLWPEEYAATLIQKTVRQYFVQREEEVQEMREFWRKLDTEKRVQMLAMNPFLARKFAASD